MDTSPETYDAKKIVRKRYRLGRPRRIEPVLFYVYELVGIFAESIQCVLRHPGLSDLPLSSSFFVIFCIQNSHAESCAEYIVLYIL